MCLLLQAVASVHACVAVLASTVELATNSRHMHISYNTTYNGSCSCRYDVGITGGVTSMDNFLLRFFPKVAAQAASGSSTSTDAYCTYSDQNLQAFTSSLFLAAAFAGLLGSFSTRCAAQLRLSVGTSYWLLFCKPWPDRRRQNQLGLVLHYEAQLQVFRFSCD